MIGHERGPVTDQGHDRLGKPGGQEDGVPKACQEQGGGGLARVPNLRVCGAPTLGVAPRRRWEDELTSKWPPRGTGTTVLTYPGSAPRGTGSVSHVSDRSGHPDNDVHKHHKSQKRINVMENIDSFPSNVQSSRQEALLYVFEDSEAVIKMIMKGRSPTMRQRLQNPQSCT